VYRDRLGERVADSALTIHSRPRSDELAAPSFLTQDGFVAEDATVIDRGVLKSFLLSQYGALKTGLERATTDGDALVIDAGDTPLEALIGSVERGVLLCRFSGGRPSAAGDFSGIAKNSYLIEDGRIGPALSETMVSGNLVRLLERVRAVSHERVDFGYAILPWVALPGVVIS
jgi:PmbA protein